MKWNNIEMRTSFVIKKVKTLEVQLNELEKF